MAASRVGAGARAGSRGEEDTEDKVSMPLLDRTIRRQEELKRAAHVELTAPAARAKRVVIDLTGY